MVLIPALAACLLAASPGEELARAQRAYDAGDYQQVLPRLAHALEGSLTPKQRLQAFLLEGMTHAAFDEHAFAVRAFREALGVDPAFDLPEDTSPKVRGLFAEARRLGPLGAPAPQHELSPTLPLAPSQATNPSNAPPPEARLDRGGLLSSPWLWAGVAALVGGAAATTWALTAPRTPRGNLGSATLP